ncbi:RpiB/LacA/LacB family sugar-phosphate isomerase [candidate division WWE3 bacterium]|uniref:RpiB/LacA/LacB family sugar-phosphate isomerase n=1 Tax=candidate division WWE3 bacterium TaxID=2053526 RepID=A0A955J1R8_UNCKA|nr:RpiB/LacA/LacB family sugar-phosphate isomerase [candidate division WWE3 bacterium]
MKIYLAADHGGYNLKESVHKWLVEKGYAVQDMGAHEYNPNDDYPDFIIPAMKLVQQDPKAKGIVICRNGVGVSIAANKFANIRAALTFEPKHVVTAVTDDNVNVIALPADFITKEKAYEILEAWLNTKYSQEERHNRRLQKVSTIMEPTTKLIPTILETDLTKIRDLLQSLETVTDLIQIDIADNKLVQGLTYLDINKILEIPTSAELELDLMVENPLEYLPKQECNVKKIVLHVESHNVKEAINKAKILGLGVGIAINTTTNITELDQYLSDVSYVQFMTVTAGGQGRPLDENVLKTIKEFAQKNTIKMQADGGINKDTLSKVYASGIRNFVVGSAIVKKQSPQLAFVEMLTLIEKIESNIK